MDDGIPTELFQILKDDAVKVLHSLCQQIWKTAAATGLEKVSFHSNIKERQYERMFKLSHNCIHFTCYQGNVQASTVCEPRISRCSSWVLKRQRNRRSNCQHMLDQKKSKRNPKKHLLLLHWLYWSLWLCGSQQTVEYSLMRWEYQTTSPDSWETCMQDKKQQLEPDMEQWPGSKLGEEHDIVHCAL